MISDNIKKYRKENNLSQDELAEKLGVSRQSISLWETGQTQPTIENIIALARIFNVSTDEILDNVGGANVPEDEAPAKEKNKVWLILGIVAAAALIVTVSGYNNISAVQKQINDLNESVSRMQIDVKSAERTYLESIDTEAAQRAAADAGMSYPVRGGNGN